MSLNASKLLLNFLTNEIYSEDFVKHLENVFISS